MLTLSSPAPARARTPRQKAAAHFSEGNRLRKAGDHARALEAFRAAYGLYPSFKIDLNIALTLQQLGRDVEAATAFARFLRLGAARSPRKILRLAQARLKQLRRRVASVRLVCPQQGALVQIDEQPRGTTPLQAAVYLEPGRRRVRLSKAGHHPRELALDLRAGDHRELTMDLTPRPLTRRLEPEESDDDPILLQQHRRKTITGYAALGTGLALAAGAAVLVGLGSSQGSDAHQRYLAVSSEPGADSAAVGQLREEIEQARNMVIAGEVLAGVAVAALGLSLYQLLTRPELERDRASVGVELSGERAVLLVGGRF